jgi:hypothetical protein
VKCLQRLNRSPALRDACGALVPAEAVVSGLASQLSAVDWQDALSADMGLVWMSLFFSPLVVACLAPDTRVFLVDCTCSDLIDEVTLPLEGHFSAVVVCFARYPGNCQLSLVTITNRIPRGVGSAEDRGEDTKESGTLYVGHLAASDCFLQIEKVMSLRWLKLPMTIACSEKKL